MEEPLNPEEADLQNLKDKEQIHPSAEVDPETLVSQLTKSEEDCADNDEYNFEEAEIVEKAPSTNECLEFCRKIRHRFLT